MSDSNTPDGEDDPVETIDRILARYPSSNPTINLLEREGVAERAFSKKLQQQRDKFKSERNAAQARVKVLADLLSDLVEDSGGLANECNGSFRDGFEALRDRAREALKENGQ